MIHNEDITRPIGLAEAFRVWWATVWRYGVLTWLLGLALALLFGLGATLLGRPFDLPESSMLTSAVSTLVSVLVMLAALRRGLLVDFGSFSLTILSDGEHEPGSLHSSLSFSRLLRIWWAIAWPIHLLGWTLPFVLVRLGLDSEPMGLAVGLTLLALLLMASGLCTWRALRMRYSNFRLVRLLPWAEQEAQRLGLDIETEG